MKNLDGNWTIEHDWSGSIAIRDANGDRIATLDKHASGAPGSGIPADTHAKLQGARAVLMSHAPEMFNLMVEMLTPGLTSARVIEDGRDLLAKLGKNVRV